jgi:hypothetical protein
MSSESPAAILFDVNGVALSVYNNTAVPTGTPAILFAGYDGYNSVSRYAMMGTQGNLGVSHVSNNVVVLSNATITANGSAIFASQFFGVQEIALVVNATVAGTGTSPSLTFTIQEVDPGNGTTTYGNSASTTALTNSNTPGVFTVILNLTTSSAVKVSWSISGTNASFTGVYATITTKATPATQTINGSITANNASVGTDGAAALGFDSQIGGIVSASAPSYSAGNLNALSLTTVGGLRVDGVYVVGAATTTAVDGMVSGGYVTATAPTYTTATFNALSLTTAGALRVDGSAVTQPVSGTVTANAGTGNFNNASVSATGSTVPTYATYIGADVVSSPPSLIAGNLAALTVTTAGRLIIDGSQVTQPVNGTVTSNQGTPNTLANAWPVEITDGTNVLGTTSHPVVVSGVVITNKATTSTVTSVAQATSNTVLLASNANRILASIYNNSGQKMYIKMGTTASTSSFSIQLMPNSYWEVPQDYIGEIDAIWSGPGSGAALVTELTP